MPCFTADMNIFFGIAYFLNYLRRLKVITHRDCDFILFCRDLIVQKLPQRFSGCKFNRAALEYD